MIVVREPKKVFGASAVMLMGLGMLGFYLWKLNREEPYSIPKEGTSASGYGK